MLSDLSSIAIRHLSNLSVGNYAPLWIPVATQLVYRWARYNVYRYFYKFDHLTFDQFKKVLTERRNSQHRLFIVLEGSQVITFFALSTINRSYLIPACYTLFHLVWTHIRKIQENVIPGAPPYLASMDGMKPFRVAS
jgi:hypothetical protein